MEVEKEARFRQVATAYHVARREGSPEQIRRDARRLWADWLRKLTNRRSLDFDENLRRRTLAGKRKIIHAEIAEYQRELEARRPKELRRAQANLLAFVTANPKYRDKARQVKASPVDAARDAIDRITDWREVRYSDLSLRDVEAFADMSEKNRDP